MDERFRGFLRNLVHSAINAAIHSIFFRMPLAWAVVLLLALIGAVVYFGVY